MGIKLRTEDRRGLLDALCDVPQFQTVRERRTFIRMALEGQAYSRDIEKALQWVNWEGNQIAVADELVRHLEGRELAAGLPTLRVLVEAIEPLAGMEHQQALADLKQRMGWAPPAAATPLDDKGKALPFDVFLCHNSKDKPEVKRIAELPIQRGLRSWLDEWSLQPGLAWQPEIERQFETTKAAAVFLGAYGLGEWQEEEGYAMLSRFKKPARPVIPVFLGSAPGDVQFTPFFDSRTRVDFRKTDPDPLKQLIFGITGQNPAGAGAPPE